ncbi:MAG: hypothetical protein E7Z89_05260 [Cyanobacteria bacterium SIG28]|nr:hypothetical protein [Cyanobacteria bacterium SIG28]
MDNVKIAQEFIQPTKIVNYLADGTINRTTATSRYASHNDIAKEVVDDVALSTTEKAKKTGFMSRIRNFFGISKKTKKQRGGKLAESQAVCTKSEQMRKEYLQIEKAYKEQVNEVKRLTGQKDYAYEEYKKLKANLRDLESKHKKLQAGLKEDTQEFYGSGYTSYREDNLVMQCGPSSYDMSNALGGIMHKKDAIKKLEPKISNLRTQVEEAERYWKDSNYMLEKAIQELNELESELRAMKRV